MLRSAATAAARVVPLPPAAAAAERSSAAAAVAAVASGAAPWGSVFTPRMLSAEWSAEGGWGAPAITPHAPLSLAPSASALHYALQVFDGFKAHRGVDGRMRMLRPDVNLRRLATSAERLVLPPFPPDALLPLVAQLVALEAPLWCPPAAGGGGTTPADDAAPAASADGGAQGAAGATSLYLRPVILSTDAKLGVGAPRSALLYVIASPVGPYFGAGAAGGGLKLLADPTVQRACRGGTGGVKAGANYAGTIAPAARAAAAHGCDQVLWLGDDGGVSEGGMMNFFAVYADGRVVTPALDGTILPGVTRRCVLDLVERLPRGGGGGGGDGGAGGGGDGGWRAVEGHLPLGELLDDMAAGRVVELFGTGTAATVRGIRAIREPGGRDVAVAGGGGGVGLGAALRDALDAIVTGRTADAAGHHPWTVVVEEGGGVAAAADERDGARRGRGAGGGGTADPAPRRWGGGGTAAQSR